MEYVSGNAVHYPERLPSQGWFRLLTIQWSPPGEPLACRLDAHRIQPVPFYDAISYTWGDEAADTTIMINSRPFLIRKNLHSALLALKNAQRHIVWVDAVCINQADEEERTAQVWQMKQIYSDAQSVKVWLGDATATSYRGLMFLRRFQRITPECTERHIKSIDDFHTCFGDILTPFREGGEALHLGLQEAFGLLKHPWWTRVWTLQESVMGKQVDCQCGYGTQSVPFACFAKLAWFTYFAVNFGVWSGHEIDSSVALRTARWTENLRGIWRDSGKVSVWGALSASWNRASTDPKDKVMGLLGLLEMKSTGDHAPGYQLSIEDNYCHLFFSLLEEANGLYPLSLISEMPEDRNPNLPSWVPDFQLHSTVDSDHLASLSKGIHPYNASLFKDDEFHVRRDSSRGGRTISVEGIDFDAVRTSGCKAPGWQPTDKTSGSDWARLMQQTLRDWRAIVNSTVDAGAATYTTGESRLCAFWRTVLVDLKQGDEDHASALGARRRDDADKAVFSELESEDGWGKLLSKWERSCMPEFRQLRLIEQLNRRFFVTEKGFFGLGPPSMVVGDRVCILRSGVVPYVLRRRDGGRWKYVGECYVHGIMDGEVVQWSKEGAYAYETFDIA
ncbi:Heterokaryon incompatibility protein 6, OR allele [Colletotrichum spinosum]|uniref:Heterokaryon incompatibility protein 6, OR allele n=1 Tax=Colletotrichum spinosum TaxID=1347390 RepID=A0A4R8QCP3_9PEZI|nr:Heterokaryon incompatibility protein 6, OR allele [Colletotrichum spinosum]